MDIEDRVDYYYAEYILPCVVNVVSEDDVMLEFDISTDVSMIYLFSHFCNLYSLYYYSNFKVYYHL